MPVYPTGDDLILFETSALALFLGAYNDKMQQTYKEETSRLASNIGSAIIIESRLRTPSDARRPSPDLEAFARDIWQCIIQQCKSITSDTNAPFSILWAVQTDTLLGNLTNMLTNSYNLLMKVAAASLVTQIL
jgi:hypothetical protein